MYDLRHLLGAGNAQINDELTRMTAGAHRAWELLFFHSPGPVQVWLATHGWATSPTYHNDIRVTLYGLADKPLVEHPLHVAFGLALELVSADVSPASVHPGDLLRVSTQWQVHQQAPEYKFSLRLSGEDGQAVQVLDYVPQNWFAPTNVWLVGRPATDQHAFLLPDDLAPGRYRITLRLYDPTNGHPLETTQGNDVPLAEVQVSR